MASFPTNRAVLKSAEVGRGLEGLRSRIAAELQPSGVEELDAVLGGGVPRGSVVELCGPASSGRTSLALSLLAQATDRQEPCAFVDVSDSLDPISVAAAGVELPRLLWIRCGEIQNGGTVPETPSLFLPAEDQRKSKSNGVDVPEKPAGGFFWQHPRDQMRGVDTAIPSLMRKQASVRSAAESARIHVVARCAGEQVERDRQLPRRDIRRPRCFPQEAGRNSASPVRTWRCGTKPWKRLEQALKTTDLLLHSGGWGVVVLDFGDVSWTDTRRIDLSTWFRFRRAVENTPTILLLLGEESCAKSCASLVLRCQRKAQNWRRAVSSAASGPSRFEGFEVQGQVIRSRTQSQHADSARWQARTLCAGSF